MAPEALFDPGLIKEGDEALGMHDMSFASIQDCDVDIRMDLYGNIILSGGTTLYAGLPDRLELEVDKKCPQKGSVKIIASADRYYSVWTGGSTLSSLSTFESQWITKEEYEETLRAWQKSADELKSESRDRFDVMRKLGLTR